MLIFRTKIGLYLRQLRYYNEKPTSELIKGILNGILSNFYLREDYFILKRSLDCTIGDPRRLRNVSIVRIGKDDIKLIQDMVPPRQLEFLKLRFELGEECLGLSHNGEIVSWWFGSDKSQPVLSGLYELKNGEFSSSEVFTKEECRGKGYVRDLIFLKDEFLRERGYRYNIMVVLKNNVRMLRIHKKLGSKIVGELRYIRIFRFPHRSLTMYSAETSIMLD